VSISIEKQHVEAPEQDRVDSKEVASQYCCRLSSLELCPRRTTSSRCGARCYADGGSPTRSRARASRPWWPTRRGSADDPRSGSFSPGEGPTRQSLPQVRVDQVVAEDRSTSVGQDLDATAGNVSGWTKNRLRCATDRSRLRPASRARSEGCRTGRTIWRRSTETS
jgi:hypothetical protein